MKKRKLKVSVTSLADFSCRTGNLDFSGNVGPSAREGIRAHQRIQEQRQVQSEVRLSTSVSVNDVDLTVSGRIDLLDTEHSRISEIKSTMVPSVKLSDDAVSLQWAQLKLYGFLFLSEVAPDQSWVELELIHINLRADDTSSSVKSFQRNELAEFAYLAMEHYTGWYQTIWHWQQRTRLSAASLDFPFTKYRDGQRDMAAAVFRANRDGGTVLCEAPTGTGKTLSSLFPVVKAIGLGHVKHAAYLTAKTSGRESAMQAVQHLEKAGLEITSVLIRSKAPTCFCSNGRCERDEKSVCPMTVGFFDRLPAARNEAIAVGVIDGDKLDEIAWSHEICPFEFALQLLPWVSIAISDYNYVFDPLVRIGRYSEPRRDTVLLVDEAHNLIDRARSMHSALLDRAELISAVHSLGTAHPLLGKRIKSLSAALLAHGKTFNSQTEVSERVPAKLGKKAGELVEAYMAALEDGPAMPDSLNELFKTACRYMAIEELFGQHHKVISDTSKQGKTSTVSVRLKCLDASDYLKKQFKLFQSTIVFSATLRPAPFYRDALGLPSDAQKLTLASPFSAVQVAHCVVGYINTRYKHRDSSLAHLVDVLFALVNSRSGNHIVFLPSYSYLEQVHAAFSDRHAEIETWCQSSNSGVEDRQQLLNKLELAGTRLGFAILGGVFGEGVDYIGDRLIGVAIVGVGLPGIGVEQDLIAECYRSQGLDGYDYAYRYPGFTKVLQTAGRVIRTETDNGVVLLIDDRFAGRFYKALYPDHWQVDLAKSLPEVEQKLENFWLRQKKGPASKKEVRAVSVEPKSLKRS